METYGVPPNCRKCGRPHEQEDFDHHAILAERTGHPKSWAGVDGKGFLCPECFLEALDKLCNARQCGSCKFWDGACAHHDADCGPPEYPLWERDGEPVNLSGRGATR